MKNKYKIFFLIVFIIGFGIGWLIKPPFSKNNIIQTDTVYKTLTPKINLTKVKPIRIDTCKVKLANGIKLNYVKPLNIVDVDTLNIVDVDTLIIHDSVNVLIPIESKTYETIDYRIDISGYNCNLDSVILFNSREITNTIIKEKKSKIAFTIGPQCGFYYTQKGWQAGVGIGIGVGITFTF